MTGRERGGVSIVVLAVLVIGLLITAGAARLGGALVGRAAPAVISNPITSTASTTMLTPPRSRPVIAPLA